MLNISTTKKSNAQYIHDKEEQCSIYPRRRRARFKTSKTSLADTFKTSRTNNWNKDTSKTKISNKDEHEQTPGSRSETGARGGRSCRGQQRGEKSWVSREGRSRLVVVAAGEEGQPRGKKLSWASSGGRSRPGSAAGKRGKKSWLSSGGRSRLSWALGQSLPSRGLSGRTVRRVGAHRSSSAVKDQSNVLRRD
ncbi:hypothetical protein NEOLEDRAFT_616201 [Neolentinus lepideus HHB14362 ss-1]|uniref:Uncharacterized protein n=1 Tax=Neolentinus lepideus HHB14362 ss-1 TaxID=1314782 RepID=A0A165QVH7_9AGAM|nr:hypothetical protein NEOLEDRAFT_616201 [Neolentinus lepideus HHB14362 ss-1]